METTTPIIDYLQEQLVEAKRINRRIKQNIELSNRRISYLNLQIATILNEQARDLSQDKKS